MINRRVAIFATYGNQNTLVSSTNRSRHMSVPGTATSSASAFSSSNSISILRLNSVAASATSSNEPVARSSLSSSSNILNASSTISLSAPPSLSFLALAKFNLFSNINFLLGGSVVSFMVIFVILLCYCCQRNLRQSNLDTEIHSRHWLTTNEMHQNIAGRLYTIPASLATSTAANDSYNLDFLAIIQQPPPSYDFVMRQESNRKQLNNKQLRAQQSPPPLIKQLSESAATLPDYDEHICGNQT